MTGKIFSIEEFSTFDGPGVRTTVFMKGCPLRCNWCHNPEGQSPETEYRRLPNDCLRCGACEGAGGGRLTEKSVEVCPRHLVYPCGEDLTPEELCDKLLKNADILNEGGGGVTFSGGEPLMQGDFVAECMKLLRGKLHCALQTSGYADPAVFTKVLDRSDYVLFDLKLYDDAEHEYYCGQSNRLILTNYCMLAQSGKEFITRIPLIPGVTDTHKNCSQLAGFMHWNEVDKVELLPYNKMSGSKYSSLLRKYEPKFDESREVDPQTEIFRSFGIEARVL